MIVGGESGPRARPFEVSWSRSLRDQCAEAGTAFFLKQLGRWIVGDADEFRYGASVWLLDDGARFHPPIIGPNTRRRPDNAIAFSLSDSHGGDEREWPADLLGCRAFPATPRAEEGGGA